MSLSRTNTVNYAKLAALGKAVPVDDDVRSLMVQLDSTAGHTNVEFQKVDVGGSSSSTASTASADATNAASTPGTLAPPPGTVTYAPTLTQGRRCRYEKKGGEC